MACELYSMLAPFVLLGFFHSAVNLAVPMGLGFEAAPKLQDFEMNGVGLKKSSSGETRSFGCLTQYV